MSNFSIDIQNINKSYEKTTALKNINLSVNKGELFGLVGPDGAGKTSLIRILTSLVLPDSGQAFVDGFDVVKDYKKIRQNVGYMPGKFSLYMDLTVLENLNFFATIFGTTIEENYELVKPIYSQIESFKHRKAGALSGGMKQKLALSCALIHKPTVLFLDEPTTGVDAVSRVEFWGMLKDLKSKGISILVSTPYMDEAELCDRVALMQSGEIMQINSPQQIVNDFSHTLWQLKSDNLYKTLQSLRNWDKTHSAHAFGQSVHFVANSSKITSSEIKEYMEEAGLENIEISGIKASIEDCFMELMTNNPTN